MGNEQSTETVPETTEASTSFDPDHLTSDDETPKDETLASESEAETLTVDMGTKKKKSGKNGLGHKNDPFKDQDSYVRLSSAEMAERMEVMRQKDPELFGEYAVSEESEDNQPPFPTKKQHLLRSPKKGKLLIAEPEQSLPEAQLDGQSPERSRNHAAVPRASPGTTTAGSQPHSNMPQSPTKPAQTDGAADIIQSSQTGTTDAVHDVKSPDLSSKAANKTNEAKTSTEVEEESEEERVPDSLEPPEDGMAVHVAAIQESQNVRPTDSSSHHSSPDAVFDDPEKAVSSEADAKDRTATKRKRPLDDSSEATPRPSLNQRKRPRNHIYSPPTSVTSSDNENVDKTANLMEDEPTPVQKKSKLKTRAAVSKGPTERIDNWAQKFEPGKNLKHPLLNPTPPRTQTHQFVAINIPASTVASSSKSANKPASAQGSEWVAGSVKDVLKPTNIPTPRSKKQKTVYTSPKGKGRARPGIQYSSPAVDEEADAEESAGSSNKENSKELATSTARRTFPHAAQALSPSRDDNNGPNESLSQPSSADEATGSDVDEESEESQYLCGICSKPFETQTQRNRHEKKATHNNLSECDQCHQGFYSIHKLAEHQRDQGHGTGTGYTGRTGAFSALEHRKLQSWRDRFCEEHDIDHIFFNTMMTDTCRRNMKWPYQHISRAEFLEQYYDVLPGRNKRSMRRYRERHFQNAAGHGNWTKEDDESLAELVDELGPKWVEIGLRLTRTQDAVSQRWRNVVQYAETRKTGDWTDPAEEDRLTEAVTQLKKKAGLPLDRSTDSSVSWKDVSRRLGGTRTPQQCSNHWRAMHYVKKNGKLVPVRGSGDDTVPRPVTSRKTPSKMAKRLAGQSSPQERPPSHRQQPKSEQYVKESDDEAEGGVQDEVEHKKSRSSSLADQLSEAAAQASELDQDKSDDEAAEEDDVALPAPPAKRTKLSARTPNGKGVKGDDQHSSQAQKTAQKAMDTTSQLFAQTQANTSAIRAPRQQERAPSQERPSPSLSIRHRPLSSPTPDARDESDEEMLDAPATAEVKDQEEDLEDEATEGSDGTSDDNLSSRSQSARGASRNSDVDGTTDESDDGSETQSESEAEDDGEKEDGTNKSRPWSSVNSFMNSIHEVASRSSQQVQKQTRKQKAVSSDDDSDND